MNGRMSIIRASGSKTEVTLLSAPPALDVLQTAVGGFIEVVPGFNTVKPYGRCVAFCNEEGKLDGLPFNDFATLLWKKSSPVSDFLVGDIVILTGDDEFMESL